MNKRIIIAGVDVTDAGARVTFMNPRTPLERALQRRCDALDRVTEKRGELRSAQLKLKELQRESAHFTVRNRPGRPTKVLEMIEHLAAVRIPAIERELEVLAVSYGLLKADVDRLHAEAQAEAAAAGDSRRAEREREQAVERARQAADERAVADLRRRAMAMVGAH